MTEAEIVAKAIWDAECIAVVDDDVQGWQQMVARAAIAALDAHRAIEKRKNCKHFARIGSGSLGSDGSSQYAWYCPECGARDSHKTPPQPACVVGTPLAPEGGK